MKVDNYNFYVLTMHDAKRIASIESQLSNLPLSFKYISATVLDENYQSIVAIDKESIIQRYKRELTIGEVGCYLSHKAIWEVVVSENKTSVIFEDDALVDKRVVSFLKELEATKIDYDVMLMGHSKKDYRNKKLYHFLEPLKVSEKAGVFSVGRGFKTWTSGAVGYVVTPEGAKKLLSISLAIKCVVDDWAFYECLGVKVKEVRPLLVWEDYINNESSLEEGRKTPAKKKVYFLVRLLRGALRNITAKVRR